MGANIDKANPLQINEGNVDRAVRIVAGLGLAVVGLMVQRTWIGLIGLLPLMTGIMGYCPLYRVLGISTCPIRRRQ
jgi:hypothetical protein